MQEAGIKCRNFEKEKKKQKRQIKKEKWHKKPKFVHIWHKFKWIKWKIIKFRKCYKATWISQLCDHPGNKTPKSQF